MTTTERITGTATRLDKRQVAAELERARARTRELLSRCSDEDLVRQPSPILSPIMWDLAHIAWFEELWLVRRVGRRAAARPDLDGLYDAFAHERADRGTLPLLSPEQAWQYSADVRAQTFEVLEATELSAADPLLDNGYVYGLVVQHELQHQETIAQSLQTMGVPAARSALDTARPVSRPESAELLVEAGIATIGTDNEPWAYDNERATHQVQLGAYAIDCAPVTCGRWLEFMQDGGYRERRHWSEDGWRWRCQEQASAPLYWSTRGDAWHCRNDGVDLPVSPGEPLEHVSWHEAQAFAAWAGKRLPTEAEWEHAASLGLESTGRVWEWTSSTFDGYPEFTAFPYREYSEAFFGGDHRVLRGGSWATDELVARVSFRNWDYPVRRQIFSGVRLARDV